MNLEEALQVIDMKCDVDLPTWTRVLYDAAQGKFGEREARGILLSNGTAAAVKDEFNRLLSEKGRQYVQQYSLVFPAVDIADFEALKSRLQKHFRTKLDYFYSEACHRLQETKIKLQLTDESIVDLGADYQNSLRGWEADIQILVGYLKKSQMSAQPNITYNFHGHNARVNTNSIDASVNVINLSESQLFADLRKALAAVPDSTARGRLVAEVETMQGEKEKPGRFAAYLKFIEHAANHVTLIAPLLPALAQWAQQ